MTKIQAEALKDLLRRVLATRPDEIGCETCNEDLGRFVELELDGKDIVQLMPLVQNHLDRCTGCREEYEALLAALKSIQSDQPVH